MAFHARDDEQLATLKPAREQGHALSGDAGIWSAFATARQADVFCGSWLAIQCAQITGARAALLLIRERDGVFTPAAIWPDRSRDVRHLVGVAETALRERCGQIERAPPAGAGIAAKISYPIDVDGEGVAVVVVEALAQSENGLASALRQLHWGAGWLEVLFRRERRLGDVENLRRSHFALDMVAVAAEHRDSGALARALATALATKLEARSVAVGLMRNGQIKLAALSHAAGFEPKSALVMALENAMEEAVDQAGTVVEPALAETEARIALAHREYLTLARTDAVLSTPLVSAGRIVGALTIERDHAEPFDRATLAMIESVGVLLGPMVDLHRQADRLIAGRLVAYSGKGVRALFGPRRPAIKLAAALGAIAMMAFAVATGPFRVSANAVIEGAVQRAAVAPFEGFLTSAPGRAGDLVGEGQVLATLDDRDLRLEAARWRSEREQHLIRYNEAVGKRERATALISEALIRQSEAQLALVEARIERATIRAPYSGIIVSGDLSQQLGTPVERGRLLFEVAPLDQYRVILQVDERDVAHVRAGQAGRLLIKGLTQDSVPISVTTVMPVATAANGRNTFRVEATINAPVTPFRPGMEGVAKLDVAERNLLWVWTRTLIDWARLTWWTWVA